MDTLGPTAFRAISYALTDPREADMRTACLLRGRMILLYVFIGSHLPLIGCTDDSKTSGTMVEVSEETKAHQKAKRGSYKGGPPRPIPKADSKKQ